MKPAAFGAAAEYLAKTYGGILRPLTTTTTVGLTRVQLTGIDYECVTLLIVNLGANTVFVAPTQSVSSSNGVALTNGGGSLSCNVVQDGLLPTLEWSAIGAGAGNSVFILRTRREVALSEER